MDKRPSLLELRTTIPAHWYWGAGMSLIALFLLSWVILSGLGLVSRIFLPSPLAVGQELIRQIESGILWQDALASLYRITLGWLFSTLLALPIGILMGNFHFFEGLFEPFIDLVRYMPAVAFIPLTILWLGIGDTQKFAILFIGTFFQEVLMIADNVKTVPREWIQVSYTFGLNKWEVLRKVILPAALPGIWDTFRITLGWAWTYLVVAELVAANVGLGYRIMRAQRFLETETILLGILIIGFMGLVTDYLFKLTYKRFFGWAIQSR
ncbi:MAG: ABC transporter permease [Anaerolineales bacterium]|nr:ABC transporter permease [Anaerolineales bacterium]MCX7609641.1 ABC transporter permease [Anaerolineales bacterium]MDW8226676.1 ABC transporter permease [Anaerolineales bacterium]